MPKAVYDLKNDDVAKDALTHPLPALFEALWKKLNAVDRARLRMWLDEERREAARLEWEKHKDRIPDDA